MNQTIRQMRALRLVDTTPHRQRPREEDFAAFAVMTALGGAFLIGAILYDIISQVLQWAQGVAW